MSDLLTNISTASPWAIPFLFFAFGLTSSLHCVGMCGPLNMLAGSKNKSSWLYQIGRLLGYLSLAMFFSFLGQAAMKQLLSEIGTWFWYITAAFVLLAALVIIYKGKSITLPSWIDLPSKRISAFAFKQRTPFLRSLLLGLSSVFLPCGVLYLTLVTLVALSSPAVTAIGVISFWAGTVPLLHFGTPWLKHLLDKANLKVPHFSAVLVVLMCALVLAQRYPWVQEVGSSCH